MEKRTLWQKIKGLSLIVGTVALAAKGTAALPAQHLVSKNEEQKNKDIVEKQESIGKHSVSYPCQKRCFPQNIPNCQKISQIK